MTPLTPSRLLQRLDAEIAAERDPLRADVKRAERAAYCARQGRGKEAQQALEEIRKRYDARPNVEVSAWVSLVESLLSYFGDMGPASIDKMRRARALSQAAGLTQLQALTSSWLAQMDYLRLDIASLSRNLSAALTLAQEGNHPAQARSALVMAQALHTAKRLDLALPWYERARKHATEDGDDATVSALMHNMAWIRTTNMRNALLTGEPDDGQGMHVLLAAESTWAYDKITNATSLDSYVPLLHAQILSCEDRHALALDLYERHLSSGVAQGLERLHGLFLADQAWCRLKVNQIEAARMDAEMALVLLRQDGNCDDRAPGFSCLVRVFQDIGDSALSEECDRIAMKLWEDHKQICAAIVFALEPVAMRVQQTT